MGKYIALISSSASNRKYPPLPLLSYFPVVCVWDGCTTIFCHLLHIYLGDTGNLFQLLMLLMFSLWYLQMIGYIMACRSCSFVCRLHHHYHNYADLSEGIELIKFLSGTCCRVCVKDWGNSLEYLSYNILGCVSSACPILLWWSWECVLYLIIIIKSEVWISNHCLGPGHETIACAVWFTVFLCVLIKHTPSTCYWQFSSKWLLATSFAK